MYFIFNHAQDWAIRHAGVDVAAASSYASWYIENYPEGDKSHADAFWYWSDQNENRA